MDRSKDKFLYLVLGLTAGLIVLVYHMNYITQGLIIILPNRSWCSSIIIGDLEWAGGKVTTRCIQQQDDQGLYIDKGLLMAVDIENDSSLSVLFIDGEQVECSYAS